MAFQKAEMVFLPFPHFCTSCSADHSGWSPGEVRVMGTECSAQWHKGQLGWVGSRTRLPQLQPEGLWFYLLLRSKEGTGLWWMKIADISRAQRYHMRSHRGRHTAGTCFFAGRLMLARRNGNLPKLPTQPQQVKTTGLGEMHPDIRSPNSFLSGDKNQVFTKH